MYQSNVSIKKTGLRGGRNCGDQTLSLTHIEAGFQD